MTNKDIQCGECGMQLESWTEWHPLAFCVLWKAGINPLTFILEGVRQLKVAGEEA